MKSKITKSAWSWIPTLYFAQGLPYVVGHDTCRYHVQTVGNKQHGHSPLHELALFTLGDKTLMESAGGHREDQTLVGDHHAISDRWRISRNSTDSSRTSCLPLLVSIHVVISFQFCHPRHRSRRVLYAGTRHQETSLLRRYP